MLRRHLPPIAVLLATCGACGTDERAGVRLPEVVLEPGFGLPCIDASTCPAACVPHAGDSVCTQRCDPMHPCPAGWSCFSSDGEDGLCVSAFASLCRPCASDLDCAPVDLAAPGLCADYGGEGRFCATACGSDADCPGPEFACRETGENAAKACVRREGICPCTPYLEALGAASPCTTSNEYGTCSGAMTCTARAWSTCDARTPAPDSLNAIDDDCDGETDEDGCLCGDGICSAACAETLATCPCDCATEGDGVCSPCGESPVSAPIDCCRTSGGAGCGDGFCLGFGCGESPTSCPIDCSTPCGNRVCEPGENPFNCAEDCQYKVCGNGICESSDGGPEGCPGDCAAFCGNCLCEPERDESLFNCPIDCGSCGDGVCSTCNTLREDRESCPIDCCEPSPETCNGLDDDCDGDTDEADATGCRVFYRDSDRDGLGFWDDSRCLCAPEGRYRTPLSGDCDDANPAIGLGTDETCNTQDDDCDGETDEGFGVGESCDPGVACRLGVQVCDGLSSVRCEPTGYQAADTRCGDARCEGNAVREVSRCDGAGACVPGALRGCFGNPCVALPEPACATVCANDTGCVAAFHCATTPDGSLCAPDLALGQACGRDAQCASGLCRDGVCCETECDGQCRSCAMVEPGRCRFVGQGADPDDDCGGCASCDGGGACVPHAAGTDPDDDCELRPPCGETGLCSGAGSCAFAPTTTPCGDGLCVGDTALLPRTCTGDGACAEPMLVACEGYRCAADGRTCATSCTTDAGCVDGFFCLGGACVERRPKGESCLRNDQCETGHCEDGYCCDSSCGGLCQRCDVANKRGTCSPVSGEEGVCSGASECVEGSCKRARGQSCTNANQCATNRCVDSVCCESTCDGMCRSCASGTCEPIRSAEEAQCQGTHWCDATGECRMVAGSACSGTCPGGFVCVDGTCRTPLPLGAACEVDAACASNQCADGVCCESACLGPCRKCRADGRCEYLPTGSEEAGDCPAQDQVCGPGGECIGTNGTVCESSADCASGFCVDGVCCDSACDGVCEQCASGTCEGVVGAPDETCVAPSICFGKERCVGVGGTPCSVDGECATGHCAVEDGVGICCESACDGPCETCLGEDPGVCEPVFSQAVPGSCDGESWCDASAMCAGVEGSGCDEDCPSGWVCVASQCRRPLSDGESCLTGEQCGSGHCVDGVCCESACLGECRRCDLMAGLCLAAETGTDPDLECGLGICSREVGGCAGRPGDVCDEDLECASGFCEGGVCCERECDGPCEACATGLCMPVDGPTGQCSGDFECVMGMCLGRTGASCEGASSCASGICSPERVCCAPDCEDLCERCTSSGCERVLSADNPGRCDGVFTCDLFGVCGPRDRLCMSDEECGFSAWCDAGTCREDGELGAVCERDAQCRSGVCNEGVCCDEECGGLCESCRVAGREGLCSFVPLGGQDPFGMCVDGVCDGAGGCARNRGAFCMQDDDCLSRFCTDSVCCSSRCDGVCQACDVPDSVGVCRGLDGVEDLGCSGNFICRGGLCSGRGAGCVDDVCGPVDTEDTGCVGCDTSTCLGDGCP